MNNLKRNVYFFADVSTKRKLEINGPLIVVSNRLPFVLHRQPDGSLIRKAR